nr:alkaline phosphatase family protein [Pseudoxanthomonas helianthi]
MQDKALAWTEERFDAFTEAFALDYLQRERPRLLYVGLGDTDEWSHAGNYELVLRALHDTDAFLRELWTWLQSQPQYRGNTTLIVTTDHGRGRGMKDWTDHGADVEGAQDIWIAIAGPDAVRRGEWRDAAPLKQGQVAATVAQAFGLDFSALEPQAYPPIPMSPRAK